MTNPDDLTPPAPEPLSAERKALLRAQLLAVADTPPAPGHRWLVPGLAAAAVVAIVGAGAFVVGQGGDGPSGAPGPFGPAGRPTSVSHQPSAVRPTSTQTPGNPGAPSTSHPAPPPRPTTVSATRHVGRTVHGLLGTAVDDTTTCEQEIADLDRHDLDGATVTADRSYGDYTTSLYETKDAWIVCDDFAAADGGAPTLLAAHAKTDAYQPDVSTVAVSENTLFSGSSQFVAAGRDFDGVQAIRYVFPDGHSEDAVVGVNGLWSMTYLPTDGPLADPRVNETTLDPIQVLVDYSDGHRDTFTLEWGLDTCAQINHGC